MIKEKPKQLILSLLLMLSTYLKYTLNLVSTEVKDQKMTRVGMIPKMLTVQ